MQLARSNSSVSKISFSKSTLPPTVASRTINASRVSSAISNGVDKIGKTPLNNGRRNCNAKLLSQDTRIRLKDLLTAISKFEMELEVQRQIIASRE